MLIHYPFYGLTNCFFSHFYKHINMKKVRLLLLTGFLLSMQFLYAQTRTVTGKITESNGAPLPGATITATGTNISVISSANGNFSITVPSSVSSLTITSVGFTTRNISLGGSTTVNVAMVSSTGELQTV